MAIDNRDSRPLPGAIREGKKGPRVCIITGRDYSLNAFRCAFYEAQDVLADVADVDLIRLRPRPAYDIRYPFQKRLIWRDFTRKLVLTNMAFEPAGLTGTYDLFIAHLPLMQDLLQLSALGNWRKHCRKSICWIDEVYASNISAYRNWLPALAPFDHVAVGLSGTAAAFEGALGRPCHYVPGAVDAARYSPHPAHPARVIDIYSIGRIWEDVHRAFREYAAARDLLYVYDTFVASDVRVKDHRQHRDMHASMAKRSRCYFVAPAKMDIPSDTGGQIEIGFRYYEATAAGAVLVGQAPDCDAFRTTFDWPDSVIALREDGSDVADVLSGLSEEPERMSGISRRNAAEALQRHDWVYRWKTIFEIAGYEATDGMTRREERLGAMARQIGSAM